MVNEKLKPIQRSEAKRFAESATWFQEHKLPALPGWFGLLRTPHYTENYQRLFAWNVACVECHVFVAALLNKWVVQHKDRLYWAAGQGTQEAVLLGDPHSLPGRANMGVPPKQLSLPRGHMDNQEFWE